MAQPPESSSRKTVTLPDELWAKIKEFRHEPRIATETAALRRLVQLGLQAAGQDKAPAAGVTRRRRPADRGRHSG
jgi:hypothetical protein